MAATSSQGSETEPSPKRFKLLCQNIREQFVNQRSSENSSTGICIDTEIRIYMTTISQMTELNDTVENSSIAYWLTRESSYPLLAPLARDLVAAPASQAYVERAFSVCGDLCARKRNRANTTLERRIFLRMNAQYTMCEISD